MNYVLYHKNCNDGEGAALAHYLGEGKEKIASGESVNYYKADYGDDLPEMEDGAVVYILDFSYPAKVMVELISKMSLVVVLDHHETAMSEFEKLPGLLPDARVHTKGDFQKIDLVENGELKFLSVFDMQESGASLAWHYFFPEEELPKLFEHIRARDLWQKLPGTDAVHSVLGLSSRHDWEKYLYDVEPLITKGENIFEYRSVLMKRYLPEVYLVDFKGYQVPCLNTIKEFASDLGNMLCQKYPKAKFSITFYIENGRTVKVSLRSQGDFNVAAIATTFGGGGHKNAAGFRVPIESLNIFNPID